MSENRVDLGNVKGETGLTGVGISRIVELPPDEQNLKRNFRIYFTDNTTFDYSLTDNEYIRRLNEMSTGSPASDKKDIPTIYLLKKTLLDYARNSDVYSVSYIDDELQAIWDAISQL